MRTITVRRSLLALLLTFSLLPVALIATAGHLVSERMTDRLVARHNRTLADQARNRAERLFDTAETLADVYARLEVLAGLPVGPGDTVELSAPVRIEIERALRRLLEVHGEFMNAYLATVDGQFLMVGYRDGRLAVRRTERQPDGAARTFWAAGADAPPTAVDPRPFDPRVRPWYVEGLASDVVVWQRPYVFASSRKVGVTASRRVAGADGATLGVFGVDLSLEDLSGYLARFELGAKGTAFALTVDGKVVAWAEEDRVLAVDSEDRPVLQTVAAVGDERFHPSLGGEPQGAERQLVHEADGEEFYTHVVPFRRGPLAWEIGVCVPRSHFTGGLGFLRLFTVAVALLTGVAAALLAVYFSRRLTRPLLDLAGRAERVREGDLEARAAVDAMSKIHEIRQLDETFGGMVEGLHELFVTRRYISGATRAMIAERTGQEIEETRGTKTAATVLFADIRGFTTFSEKHPPEDVIELLNRYLSLQSDQIHAHGGVVDKFIGDEVMALFLGPGHEPDAVRAALDIQEGIRAVNEERRAAGRDPVEVGIGIQCGQVLMGDIGSETRMDYSAIGDTVNVASRLTSEARGGQVVVSQAVVDGLDESFEVEHVEMIQVKGRQSPVAVHRVTGRRG